MPLHDDPKPDTISRRRILKTSAVGGAVAGAVWTTPAILSIESAYAVGSCPGGSLTFLWSSGGDGTRHTAALNPLVGNIGGPTGVDVRVISTAVSASGVASAGLVGDNWMTRSANNASYPPQINCGSAATTNWPRGNQGSFYSLLMNNTTTNTCTSTGVVGRFVEVEFGFFVPGSTTQKINVQKLNFSLYDVDSAGSYRDQVSVAINGNAVTTPVTLAPTPSPQAVATRPGATPTMNQPTNSAVISAISGSSAASNSTNGNIALQFSNGVDVNRVRVRFTDMGAAAPTTIQWVGIGNMTFCKGALA